MARKQDLKFNIPSVDDLFTNVKGKDILDIEKVIKLPIEKIMPFPNHPFKVKDDKEMENMVESIKEYGVIHPIIVRQRDDGSYEMISGHRRKRAAELAGISEIKAIVRNLTDEEATIYMVDTNLQREEVLPSEKAFAYKMKLDALNKQGKRNDLTCAQVGHKSENQKSRDILSQEVGESREQIRRYIRLTELIPKILEMVDNKRIAFSPAVEISYLKQDEQYVLLDCMECNEATPSQAQAIHLKKLSQEGTLTAEKIEEIMGEEKANQRPKYKINYKRFERVLPRNIVTEREVEDFLYKCVEEHNQRAKQKAMSR